MSRIVAGFGLLILVLSLFFLDSPEALVEFSATVLTPTGLWWAAGFRVSLGVLLWLAADASRTPRTFRVLGVLFVLGGLAIPVVGLAGIESIVAWGMAQGDLFLRATSLIGAGLGAFLLWATMSRRPAE